MKSLKFVLICLTVFGLVLFSSNVFAKETLVYGTTEKIIDMDPAIAYDFHTWEIFYNIYEGLMKYSLGETTLEPGLAKQLVECWYGGTQRSGGGAADIV